MKITRLLVVGALCAIGCGGALKLEARVVHPARLTIDTTQTLTVVHGGQPVSRLVADALVDALRVRGVAVDVPVALLSEVPDGTSHALLINVATQVTLRTEWTSRPENVCGPYGCYVRNVSQPYEMPYVVARFEARMVEYASRRVSQAYSGTVEVPGVDDGVGRRRVAARVLERLVAGMSPQTENVRVAFEAFDDATAEAAVIDVREGRFDDARSRLEARLSDDSLDDAMRARVHYDLALVLAFDPATPTRPLGLRDALAHAEACVRLDPTRRHVAILERVRMMVDEARRPGESVLDPASAQPIDGIPAVPDAYRGEIPPPPP